MAFVAPLRHRVVGRSSTAAAAAPLASPTRRGYARLTLIGNLVQDARLLNENVQGKEPIVALKVAVNDPLSRAAREAGREQTSSYFDILSFNPGLRPYLSGFQKGSLVHVEADIRLETTREADGAFGTPKTRLSLREVTKLRNPNREGDA